MLEVKVIHLIKKRVWKEEIVKFESEEQFERYVGDLILNLPWKLYVDKNYYWGFEFEKDYFVTHLILSLRSAKGYNYKVDFYKL